MSINNREDLNKYYNLINELVDKYVEKHKIRPSNLIKYLSPGSDRFNKFLLKSGLSEVAGAEVILKDVLYDRAGMEEDGVYTFESYKYYESSDFKIKSMKICLYKGIDKSNIKEEKVIADYFDINLGDIDVEDAEKHLFRINDWNNDDWDVVIYSKEDINIIKDNFVDFIYEELNDSKIIVSGEIEIELNSIIDKQGSQEKISKKFTEKFLIDTVSKTLGNDFKFLENVDGYYLWVN